MAAKEKQAEAAEDKEKEEGAPEGAEGEEGAEGGGKVKGKRKLIIIAGAVVLVIAIGAGLLLSGVIGGGDKKALEEAKKIDEKAADLPVYYELPQFLVNLSTTTGKASFLKMTATLELKNLESKAIIEANQPRILDTFNTYLRELRPSDLAGSAGIYRLREELINRMNATVEEGIVKDILFSEIIIQ